MQYKIHEQMYVHLLHLTFTVNLSLFYLCVRLLEQLVLYVRSLQLLSSSLQLARREIKDERLQISNALKTCEYMLYKHNSHPLKFQVFFIVFGHCTTKVHAFCVKVFAIPSNNRSTVCFVYINNVQYLFKTHV